MRVKRPSNLPCKEIRRKNDLFLAARCQTHFENATQLFIFKKPRVSSKARQTSLKKKRIKNEKHHILRKNKTVIQSELNDNGVFFTLNVVIIINSHQYRLYNKTFFSTKNYIIYYIFFIYTLILHIIIGHYGPNFYINIIILG